MPTLTATVFLVVYLGLVLGRLPGLRLDRTGVVLLGAIVLLATGAASEEAALAAVDVPTVSLLFALMVVSAQLRLGGFYTKVTERVAALHLPPLLFFGCYILAMAGLAAIFSNDIICLAATPVTIRLCRAKKLDPVPFLLGLACATNIGSAATLIGNPQNILIGEVKKIDFTAYILAALPAVLLGLAATWLVTAWLYRDKWHYETAADTGAGPVFEPVFDPWKSGKGLLVAGVLMVLFLADSWPRDLAALAGAGLLLASRRLHSRDMLGLVDWQLLVLFVGLFIVNDTFARTGLPAGLAAGLAGRGLDLGNPGWLTATVALLSNAVSNVPAVMLLLPLAPGPDAGLVLAIASTLAGNALVVGSIANIIVIEEAARHGVAIGWRTHARLGLPVTVLSLAGFLALL